MLEKKKILLIIAAVLSLVVAILMIVKNALVLTAIQTRIEILSGLGTTFEAEGVNISLAYLSVTLSIIIGITGILGSLLSFKGVEIRGREIGSIILVAIAVFTWIGIFIPVIDTSFTVMTITFYVDIDLVETLIGVGEPIFLSISSVLTILAVYVLSE